MRVVLCKRAARVRRDLTRAEGDVYFLVTSDSSTVRTVDRTVGPTVPYYVVKLLGIVLHNRSKF